MGRKHRIEYSGAIYHVIQRGNNKSYIFQDEEDKLQLLYLIEKYKQEMMYEIFVIPRCQTLSYEALSYLVGQVIKDLAKKFVRFLHY